LTAIIRSTSSSGCVVDQQIEPAVALERRHHRAVSGELVGHVALDERGRRAELLHRLLEQQLAPRHQDDAGAALDEAPGDGEADAFAGAGDDRRLALKRHLGSSITRASR
jgi:hypothetical protein